MPTGTQDGRRRLYLDFDGYFAAVEEQAAPALHGRPVAVLPYPEARTCVISANAAAKRHGVGTGAGRTLAEVRAALSAAGVDVDEAAAYEAMARAFNDCEAEDLPLMAVRLIPRPGSRCVPAGTPLALRGLCASWSWIRVSAEVVEFEAESSLPTTPPIEYH